MTLTHTHNRTGHATGTGAATRSPRRRPHTAFVGWATLLVAGLGLKLLGCGAGTPPPQTDMRTIEEPRAVRVIQQALESTGVKPGPGRDVELTSGKPLYVDVTLGDTEFAVAYLAGLEVARLAKDLPERNQGNALRVMRVGNTLVLLLYEDTYQYDAAETHTATAVSAEAKLKRDVTDFVHRAVKGRGLK